MTNDKTTGTINGSQIVCQRPGTNGEYEYCSVQKCWLAWQAAIEHAKKTMGERS